MEFGNLSKYDKRINMIVAIADNNAIGKNNNLLCYLPADLKWFKKNTLNNTVIMGRKTFQSLPNGALPQRQNIVLSKSNSVNSDNIIVAKSMQEAINMADTKDIYIIGGASVYKQFLPFTDRLIITRIFHNFDDADTFFPQVNFDDWKMVFRQDNKPNEKNKYKFSFFIYEKKI